MNMSKSTTAFSATILLAVIISACTSSTGTDCCPMPQPEFNSKAAPGDSAKSFLEGDQYTTLNVEIDYMEGYEPTAEALDSLRAFLRAHLNKANINVGVPNSIPAQGQNAYTANQIRDIEDQHRDHYTTAGSDTLWAYMLFVDGEFSQGNVLGIAYYNTSMAFFGETIYSNTRESGQIGSQPTRPKMEATVFNHEFGHNLGLVNNGTPMQNDHQDSAHGSHCTDDTCLMYYSVQTTDYFANLFDGDIPDLQQYCTADLQGNGGK